LNKGVKAIAETESYLKNTARILEETLAMFNVTGKITHISQGPSVTRYEYQSSTGVKVRNITDLADDIKMHLAATDIRIEAPIPGKSAVGIEVPNKENSPVAVRDLIESDEFNKSKSNLTVAVGKDIAGKIVVTDIAKMPHLLIAGATGSGKSVCINTIIMSILYKASPEDVRLIMIDPKIVELSVYNGIPHLLIPVVTDPKKASVALQKIVVEMDDRYETFKNSGTKNISTYNEYVEKELKKKPDCGLRKMPFILVIIDELADLMLVAGKEVEDSIMRITQMARAAGIHLIIATQRPSTDVITGVIKANIPTRIAFAVSSGIDSRTILDMQGAEKLLGRGDMLFLPQGENSPTRIQGAWISEDEIKRIVDFVCEQQIAQYDQRFQNLEVAEKTTTGVDANTEVEDEYDDPLYNDIVEFVVTTGKASASLLQRRFKLGYNRAARVIDLLEERGIIGPMNGSKPREVLVKLNNNNNDDYDDEII
jgi:S-DNA-T family DNA segregation ATPase FtsK/SpoIIIE